MSVRECLAALLAMAPDWKQPRRLRQGRVTQPCPLRTPEYYFTMRLLAHTTAGMHLQRTTPSVKSQSQTVRYSLAPFIEYYNDKITETESRLVATRGADGVGGKEVGVSVCGILVFVEFLYVDWVGVSIPAGLLCSLGKSCL